MATLSRASGQFRVVVIVAAVVVASSSLSLFVVPGSGVVVIIPGKNLPKIGMSHTKPNFDHPNFQIFKFNQHKTHKIRPKLHTNY